MVGKVSVYQHRRGCPYTRRCTGWFNRIESDSWLKVSKNTVFKKVEDDLRYLCFVLSLGQC